MRSKHLIVTAAVAFSLLALPAQASTRQEAPLLSDAIRCVSLYLIASDLYGTETPEGQEAITLGREWYNRAKEKNNRADSNLPEDDPGTTESMIARDLFSLTFLGVYSRDLSDRQDLIPDYIRAVRKDLEACKA